MRERTSDIYKRCLVLILIAGLVMLGRNFDVHPSFAAAIEKDDLEGTVYIEGDQSEVTWDKEGISRWEAEGNAYLRFTSAGGNVFELRGDRLVYSLEGDTTPGNEYVTLEGNIEVRFNGNSLRAGNIKGWLRPLDIAISDGVKLTAEIFEVSCQALTLMESASMAADSPIYTASVPMPGESEIIFYRDVEATPGTPVEQGPKAIPLPVDLNPDFKIITIKAVGFEVVFEDENVLGVEFPNGAEAVTDTGYTITQATLSMKGLDEFSATDCRIIGPDVIINCDEMVFFPEEKHIELTGNVSLASGEGGLCVDALTVLYDDNGVKELRASGNVRIDFSVFLSEESERDEPSGRIRQTLGKAGYGPESRRPRPEDKIQGFNSWFPLVVPQPGYYDHPLLPCIRENHR